jgi:hypothetical protein
MPHARPPWARPATSIWRDSSSRPHRRLPTPDRWIEGTAARLPPTPLLECASCRAPRTAITPACLRHQGSGPLKVEQAILAALVGVGGELPRWAGGRYREVGLVTLERTEDSAGIHHYRAPMSDTDARGACDGEMGGSRLRERTMLAVDQDTAITELLEGDEEAVDAVSDLEFMQDPDDRPVPFQFDIIRVALVDLPPGS